MDDLILKTRIASLEAGLATVKEKLGEPNKRQVCLKQAITKLEACHNDGLTLANAVTEYLQKHQREAADENKKGTLGVDKVVQDALTLTRLLSKGGKLTEVRNTIEAWSKTCAQSTRDRATESQQEFEKKAKDLLNELRKEPDWRKYDQVRLEADTLLTEFSEFLAGSGIRDSGFDEGICEFAEDLLKSWVWSDSGGPLTMPIPHEVVQILSNTVGLTYPEWTLWSLPMTAYEFWGVYARKQNRIRAAFEKSAKRASLDLKRFSFNKPRSLLADAFATFSMGPAYAFYAFQLSLNPVATRGLKPSRVEPPPPPSERAEVILEMLDRMDQKQPQAWPPVIDELRQSWNQALEAADNPRAALLPHEVRTLKSAVEILAETLLDGTKADFKVESWPRVLHWAEDLRSKVPEESVDAASEMRDVVNAAWMARRRETDRKLIADIAARATQLRDTILEKRDQPKKDPDTRVRSFARPF
jgi:hypothetical protein